MSAGTNFFVVSCAILIFSIINFSLGPIINKKVVGDWDLANCAKLSDDYETRKKTTSMTEIEKKMKNGQ